MMTSRFAAAALACCFAVAPAAAGEYTSYENLDIVSPASSDCRVGMLVNLPSSWQSDDGAVILLTVGQPRDAARDMLVSALLSEHAAVLELAPLPCGGLQSRQDGVIAGALGALDAMKRTMGAGLVVAIGYGPGGVAILEVVREPVASVLGADGPRYAAAVAMGDGAPTFALGAPWPAGEQAPSRLAALCRALAGVAESMGATPQRTAPASAADACNVAISGQTSLAASPLRAASR